MIGMILIALQAASSAPTATPEAEDLGIRLARSGGLAAMAPALIEKDAVELAQEAKSLSDAERQHLVEIGRAQGRAGLDRIMRAIGIEYAKRLSVEDLRQLVTHAESPAAARWRAAEPLVVAAAMKSIGELDLKKSTASAFCKETGKLCDRR